MSIERKQKPSNQSDLIKQAAQQKADQIADGTYVPPFYEWSVVDDGKTNVEVKRGLLSRVSEKLAAKEKTKAPQA